MGDAPDGSMWLTDAQDSDDLSVNHMASVIEASLSLLHDVDYPAYQRVVMLIMRQLEHELEPLVDPLTDMPTATPITHLSLRWL
ncbi:MAG: hypothetical protein ACKVOJ_02250 [Sphingomonadaceae bacterium]